MIMGILIFLVGVSIFIILVGYPCIYLIGKKKKKKGKKNKKPEPKVVKNFEFSPDFVNPNTRRERLLPSGEISGWIHHRRGLMISINTNSEISSEAWDPTGLWSRG